jgi:hypothetical protein
MCFLFNDFPLFRINEQFALSSLLRFCEQLALNIAYYSAFFAKKDGTKKASRGSLAAPGTYPASDVQPSARQSTTFCRFVTVTKCGHAVVDYPSPAPTQSDIGGVIPRLSCSRYVWFYPTAVGADSISARIRTIHTFPTAVADLTLPR